LRSSRRARPLRVYFDTANIQDISDLAVDRAMRRAGALHCIEFAQETTHPVEAT
jgi:hypothetical protein